MACCSEVPAYLERPDKVSKQRCQCSGFVFRLCILRAIRRRRPWDRLAEYDSLGRVDNQFLNPTHYVEHAEIPTVTSAVNSTYENTFQVRAYEAFKSEFRELYEAILLHEANGCTFAGAIHAHHGPDIARWPTWASQTVA